MTFEEMLESVKEIQCQETRAQEKDYCEVVVAETNLEPMVAVLNGYFGIPFKPASQQPSEDAQRYAEPYGGVSGNQTLFHRQTGDFSELALLWPWGSGASVTVKIARGNKSLSL